MIQVHDGLVEKELYNELLATFLTPRTHWKLGRTDNGEQRYLTIHVAGKAYEEDGAATEGFSYDVAERLFADLKNKFTIPDSAELESCYLNGLMHGMEAHPHVDSTYTEPFTTVIVYLCHHWSIYWGGETVFFDGEYSANPMEQCSLTVDIKKSVLPKRNRIVMFDGKITHAVRQVSSTFPDIRATLMFKLKNCAAESVKVKNA